MKSSSPFQLIRHEIELADQVEAVASEAVQEQAREQKAHEINPPTLDVIYLAPEELVKIEKRFEEAHRIRGRKMYKLASRSDVVEKILARLKRS